MGKNKWSYNETFQQPDGGKKRKGKDKGKRSKASKGRNAEYNTPAFGSIRPSLSGREAKLSTKSVLAPVEVPKEFRKNRLRCNHAGALISPAEFKAMTPAYAAFTPLLDAAIETYGEDNVAICRSCYDVLVNTGDITSTGMRDSVLRLYLSANLILAHKRMTKDEIKELAGMRDGLTDWDHAIFTLRKLEEDGTIDASRNSQAAAMASGVDAAKLSKLSKADRI